MPYPLPATAPIKIMLLFPCLLLFSRCCHQQPDLEAEKRAILAIHEDQRKAHLAKDVALLLGDSIPDYIEVNRGQVKMPGYAESAERFKSYFDAVDFIRWDDLSPPVISFSDDGTMATSVVNKLVITRSTSADHRLDTTHFAWLAVFKKTNGKWALHRMGSTND